MQAVPKMDRSGLVWYFSCMTDAASIPVFALLGETAPFPDVVHCEDFSARAPVHGWRIPAHRHGQLSQLFLIRRGELGAQVDGSDHMLRDGQFIYIPAQSVHEFTFRPDTEGQVISFPAAIVQTVGPAPEHVRGALAQTLTGATPEQVSSLARMLRDTMGGAGNFRSQSGVALAHAILAALADISTRNAPALTPSDARLADFDHLIARHIGDGWTLPDFARALSLSVGHLSRLCRAATGQGAAAYIEAAVMEEACRMLAFTRLPVSGIGYRLGYADPSYFSRRFRAVRGETPSQYRARFAG